MTSIHVAPATSVQGEVHVPGDKSVSHRALLCALVSTRATTIRNLATGADVATTLRAIEQLGATVTRDASDDTCVTVRGVGLHGIRGGSPDEPLTVDCGNAGTLARLLAGLLAMQPAGRAWRLTGDASLSARPMARIAAPLAWMGATIDTTGQSHTLPMVIEGGGTLEAGTLELDVASAQVQGALLLAGLGADGPTTVEEPAVMRDHTERMLRRAGVRVRRSGRSVTIEPPATFELPDTTIAADPSSAAPFVLAATVLHGSHVWLPHVIHSPGRSGFVDVLEQMGARIGIAGRSEIDGEPVASYEVQHAALSRTFVEVDDVARMIDELPLLALAGHFRPGEFVVRGASELRVKESDRIETLAQAMKRCGVSLQPLKDGFVIRGSGVRPDGGTMDARGDHRLAMLGGVLGLVSRHGVTVENADCVDVSFPGYFDVLAAIAQR